MVAVERDERDAAGNDRGELVSRIRANAPREMLEAPRWLCWRWETREREGKPTKVPINPKTGNRGSSTDGATWGAFDQAAAALRRWPQLAGLGFALGDGWAGVDLDRMRDAATGELSERARAIRAALDSYTEVSPRGGGLHIIVYAPEAMPDDQDGHRQTLPDGSEIEAYRAGRFFTVTGDRLEGAPAVVNQRTAELAALWRETFMTTPTAKASAPRPPRPSTPLDLSDTELLEQARNAANGAKFRALYDQGDTSAYGGDDSRADSALVLMLAFETGDDTARIDRLFRQSALMRDKWERDDYAQRTITRALAVPHEVRKAPRSLETRQPSPSAEDGGASDGGPTIGEFKLTDLGNSERLVSRHGDKMRWVAKVGKWIIWDGRRWALDESEQVLRFAKETIRSIYHDAADSGDDDQGKARVKALVSHALKSESERALSAMVKLARHQLAISPNELDVSPWLFNVQNGTLDLQTGRLRPHDPRDMLTKLAPVTYDPNASAPTWLAFLNRIMAGNAGLIAFLQRAVGYSLTGDTGEQCLFVPHGKGANGKSTFLTTLERMAGDYATHSRPETFMAHRNEQIPQDVARLNGARLVVTVETEDGQRLAESLIKQLTGGDRITARRMKENEFEFSPVLKLWMATNHKPQIRGTDHAIWRRVKLIPFRVQIPDSEKDSHLGDKLDAERAGLLNWAIQGCLIWQRDGLGAPPEVVQATAEYRAENDAIGQFLSERCEKKPGAKTPTQAVYLAYKAWCVANGEQHLEQRKFTPLMRERGYEQGRGTGNKPVWLDLSLLPDDDGLPWSTGQELPSYQELPNLGVNSCEKQIQSGDTAKSVTDGNSVTTAAAAAWSNHHPQSPAPVAQTLTASGGSYAGDDSQEGPPCYRCGHPLRAYPSGGWYPCDHCPPAPSVSA